MKELGASRRTTKDNVAMKPTKKKLRLPGLPPIDVVSNAKANACDYLVCYLVSAQRNQATKKGPSLP